MRVSCRACTHTLVYILEFAQSTFTHSAAYFLFVCWCLPGFCLALPACKMCACVCAEECVLVCVETHVWLYACAIYTTCTTSISLTVQLCILRHVSFNKHIWVPVCLVCVCFGFFFCLFCILFFFCLNLSVCPSGITSQGSYQTWVTRGVWVTLLHLGKDAAESITDKVIFFTFFFLTPVSPTSFTSHTTVKWYCLTVR